ncbi:hypothetical protein ACKLNR_012738 [Fusarium oxysporum f. sp. zingiberi]
MATDMDNLNRFVAQKNLERLQHYDIALTDPASDSNAIIGDKYIASEINGPPPPGRKFTSWKEFKRDVIDAGPHLPNSYYKSMVEAIKTTAKKETTEGNGF